MALRTKTIEYAYPISTASVGAGSARDFTSIDIYIPETPTFRSVILEVSCYDNTGTAASVTSVLMGISLGAVTRNDTTVTQTITNSGENQGLIFTRDVTSYFATNWTGTSMASGCRLTVGGMSTGVATAKLLITYEYDDTGQNTRIKTVRIPIDGNTGALTTTLSNVGGVANQIPNLDTWLPEASKVYRDIFFETYTHTGKTTGTTDRNLNLRFNGTNTLSVLYEAALISDFMIKRIDKLLGNITTSQTNDVEASTANTDMPFTCLSGMLVVTYEYDHSASTRVMNSIMLPSLDESGWVAGPTTADKSRFTRRVYIQEPGTITLEQSGLLVSMIDDAAMTLDLRIGAQDSRTFAHTATVRCGSVYQMRRFDSGAAGTSSGVTLSRGINDIVIDYFTTGTGVGTLGSNINGVMILNYTSDIHPDGDGAHNHTTIWINRPWTAGLNQRIQYSPSTVPNIPESEYYITSIGYEIKFITTTTASANASICISGEVQSGEADGAGWYSFYDSIYSNDPEIGTSVIWARARDEYKRYPTDTDSSRLEVENARDYRIDTNPNVGFSQLQKIITYHNITYPIAGTITGGNGVDPIIVRAFRVDSGELIEEVTASSGDGNLTGTFNITWYDNTVDVIVIAYQATDYKGTSIRQVAGTSNSFDINFSTGGTGEEYAFGFA
jgi:hypothetical protein